MCDLLWTKFETIRKLLESAFWSIFILIHLLHNMQTLNQFRLRSVVQCLCCHVLWLTAVILLCLQCTIWFEADNCRLRHRWWWGAFQWAWLTLLPALPGHVAVPSHRSERIPGDRITAPTLKDFLYLSQAQKGSNKGLNYTHICTSFPCSGAF